MRVLVMGASGQLGSELRSVLSNGHEVVAATRSEADVTELPKVIGLVEQVQPDVVVNSAAFTDVDGCENDRERAFLVNALGARNVAIAARKAGAKLVYISTDYVFDGRKDGRYLEFDLPSPINVYGESKLWGERLVKEQLHRFFIVRTAWLYGRTGKNFVKTMLRLAHEKSELRVVNDQRGTPTNTEDLARQILQLIATDAYGTYHCTSQGDCTWYQFAVEIFRLAGLKVEVCPVPTEEYPRPARRPRNSVLENYMLKLQGLDIMPRWEEGLARFMPKLEGEG